MRNPEPSHKKVYVRFHSQLDVLINDFSIKTGMHRATAIVWIINCYMNDLISRTKDITEITKPQLGFVPEGEAYYLPIGRTDAGRIAGKRTILTLENVTDRNINYLSVKLGYTPSQFRTEIVVKYFFEAKKRSDNIFV